MTIMGEVLGCYENHVRIDKERRTRGTFQCCTLIGNTLTNEFNMAKDAVDTACELAQTAGFEVLSRNDKPNPPGYSIHEVGTQAGWEMTRRRAC